MNCGETEIEMQRPPMMTTRETNRNLEYPPAATYHSFPTRKSNSTCKLRNTSPRACIQVRNVLESFLQSGGMHVRRATDTRMQVTIPERKILFQSPKATAKK